MRILHFADLHLGVETYGRTDPMTGLSSRLNDFLHALDELVEFALNNEIDLVLFCGDAYKNRDPGQTYQREFAKRIKRLTGNDIAVFLLAGNHDLPNAIGRATAVEIFDTLAIPNVVVANQPAVHKINTRGGKLQVVALPWARYSKLLSREDKRNLTAGQINQKLEEITTAWINTEVETLDPALSTIFAGHLSHSGAMPGTEKSMLVGRDYVIPVGSLANSAFDYVALGHIHKAQEIQKIVPIVYSGSLQTIDFGDEGQDKGFYLINLDAKAARGNRLKSFEFHKIESRRFLTIHVDADTDNPMSTILRAIERKDKKDAVVRVYIKISAEKAGMISEGEIRRSLQDAYFIASIYKEVEREFRSRLAGHSVEVLTPLEALQLYFQNNKVPVDKARILLEYGERLLEERSSLE